MKRISHALVLGILLASVLLATQPEPTIAQEMNLEIGNPAGDGGCRKTDPEVLQRRPRLVRLALHAAVLCFRR